LRKHLKTVTLLVLTACILWRLWRGLNWTEVRYSFSQANALLLAAAIAVSCATNLLRAFRWRALLSPLVSAGIREVFAATNIGIGASFLFGGAVGELIRPLALPFLSPHVRPAASFSTVVVERVCDLSVLFILFGLNLLWLPALAGQRMESAHIREIGIILLTLPALGLGALLLPRGRFVSTSSRRGERLVAWRLAPNRALRAASRFHQQLTGAFRVLSSKRELIVVTLFTVGQWLTVLLANWLILLAFGLPFGLKQSLLVMCCGLVGSTVPTPGGAAGAFHAAISGGLIFLGVTLGQAAAISITAHLVGFVPALAFGSYYLLHGGVNLTQLQQEMSTAARQSSQSWRLT
jgi:uncharacterized protein (TIRG00374 family)